MSMTPNLPLTTERLTLRAFRQGDQDGLRALRSDPEMLKHLPFPLADDAMLDEIVTRRLSMTSLESEEGSILLGIEETSSKTLAGDVGLMRYQPDASTAEIGYSLAREFQGRGYVQEACRVLMAWGFETAGLHRIIGLCDARNEASANVMRRLGMRQEAHMRQAMKAQGEWTDTLQFAILENEWNG